jgi:hypothetical protein
VVAVEKEDGSERRLCGLGDRAHAVEATAAVGWCGLAWRARRSCAGVAVMERKAGERHIREGDVREPLRSGSWSESW